jgi:hypothetical protein
MAYSEGPILISMVAETTVSSTALYRIAWVGTSEGVVVGDQASTGKGGLFAGICYGYTHSTSTAAREMIPIAVGGVAKVACIASTAGPGLASCWLSASSDGWGMTASTKGTLIGRVIAGAPASGAGAVKSVLLFGTAPLEYTASMLSCTG